MGYKELIRLSDENKMLASLTRSLKGITTKAVDNVNKSQTKTTITLGNVSFDVDTTEFDKAIKQLEKKRDKIEETKNKLLEAAKANKSMYGSSARSKLDEATQEKINEKVSKKKGTKEEISAYRKQLEREAKLVNAKELYLQTVKKINLEEADTKGVEEKYNALIKLKNILLELQNLSSKTGSNFKTTGNIGNLELEKQIVNMTQNIYSIMEKAINNSITAENKKRENFIEEQKTKLYNDILNTKRPTASAASQLKSQEKELDQYMNQRQQLLVKLEQDMIDSMQKYVRASGKLSNKEQENQEKFYNAYSNYLSAGGNSEQMFASLDKFLKSNPNIGKTFDEDAYEGGDKFTTYIKELLGDLKDINSIKKQMEQFKIKSKPSKELAQIENIDKLINKTREGIAVNENFLRTFDIAIAGDEVATALQARIEILEKDIKQKEELITELKNTMNSSNKNSGANSAHMQEQIEKTTQEVKELNTDLIQTNMLLNSVSKNEFNNTKTNGNPIAVTSSIENPQAFVDEIAKQLQGHSVKVDVELNKETITEEIKKITEMIPDKKVIEVSVKQNDLYNSLNHWKNEISSSGMGTLPEQVIAANTKTGYSTNSNIKSTIAGLSGQLINETIDSATEAINALFHSHPDELSSAFSYDDIRVAAKLLSKGITEQYVVSLNNIAKLDLSKFTEKDVAKISKRLKELTTDFINFEGDTYEAVKEEEALMNAFNTNLKLQVNRLFNDIFSQLHKNFGENAPIDLNELNNKLLNQYSKAKINTNGDSEDIINKIKNLYNKVVNSFENVDVSQFNDAFTTAVDNMRLRILQEFQENMLKQAISEVTPHINPDDVYQKLSFSDFKNKLELDVSNRDVELIPVLSKEFSADSFVNEITNRLLGKEVQVDVVPNMDNDNFLQRLTQYSEKTGEMTTSTTKTDNDFTSNLKEAVKTNREYVASLKLTEEAEKKITKAVEEKYAKEKKTYELQTALEKYRLASKEIDNVKLLPETDETKRKLQELTKLLENYQKELIAITGLNNNDSSWTKNHYTGESVITGLVSHEDEKAIKNIVTNADNVTRYHSNIDYSELTNILDIIQKIDGAAEKAFGKFNFDFDLEKSRQYALAIKSSVLNLADFNDEMISNKPGDTSYDEAKRGIDAILSRYPELEKFKSVFTDYFQTSDFVKTDEWNNFLATLPQAHKYLESIGCDFEKIKSEQLAQASSGTKLDETAKSNKFQIPVDVVPNVDANEFIQSITSKLTGKEVPIDVVPSDNADNFLKRLSSYSEKFDVLKNSQKDLENFSSTVTENLKGQNAGINVVPNIENPKEFASKVTSQLNGTTAQINVTPVFDKLASTEQTNPTENIIRSQEELQKEIKETNKYIETEKRNLSHLDDLINGKVSFTGKKEANESLRQLHKALIEQEATKGRLKDQTVVAYNNVYKAAKELGSAQSVLDKNFNPFALTEYEKALERVKGSYDVTKDSIELFTNQVKELQLALDNLNNSKGEKINTSNATKDTNNILKLKDQKVTIDVSPEISSPQEFANDVTKQVSGAKAEIDVTPKLNENVLANFKEELHKIQAEKEKISNNGISYVENSEAINREKQALTDLSKKVSNVTTSVNKKTEAFKKEGQTVTGSVKKEIQELKNLSKQLLSVKNDVNKVSKAIKSISTKIKFDVDLSKLSIENIDNASIASFNAFREQLAGLEAQLNVSNLSSKLTEVSNAFEALSKLKLENLNTKNLKLTPITNLISKSENINALAASLKALAECLELLKNSGAFDKDYFSGLKFTPSNVKNMTNMATALEVVAASLKKFDQEAKDALSSINKLVKNAQGLKNLNAIINNPQKAKKAQEVIDNKKSDDNRLYTTAEKNKAEKIDREFVDGKYHDQVEKLIKRYERLNEVIAVSDNRTGDLKQALEDLRNAHTVEDKIKTFEAFKDAIAIVEGELKNLEKANAGKLFTNDINSQLQGIQEQYKDVPYLSNSLSLLVSKIEQIGNEAKNGSADLTELGKRAEDAFAHFKKGMLPTGEVKGNFDSYDKAVEKARELVASYAKVKTELKVPLQLDDNGIAKMTAQVVDLNGQLKNLTFVYNEASKAMVLQTTDMPPTSAQSNKISTIDEGIASGKYQQQVNELAERYERLKGTITESENKTEKLNTALRELQNAKSVEEKIEAFEKFKRVVASAETKLESLENKFNARTTFANNIDKQLTDIKDQYSGTSYLNGNLRALETQLNNISTEALQGSTSLKELRKQANAAIANFNKGILPSGEEMGSFDSYDKAIEKAKEVVSSYSKVKTELKTPMQLDNNGIAKMTAQVIDLNGQLKSLTFIYNNTSKAMAMQTTNIRRELTGMSGVVDAIKKKMRDMMVYWTATFFSPYDIIRYTRNVSRTIINLNTQMTELAKVSDLSIGQLEKRFESWANTAKKMGATVSDTISATADWSRLGYSVDEAEKLAEIAILYKNVGDGIDIEAANESLISTMKGFQLEASQAERVIDSFNEVSNNFAINSAGIGEALQRSAASFYAANTDLNSAIALITASNTVLQDPTRVGNMWKTKFYCLNVQKCA